MQLTINFKSQPFLYFFNFLFYIYFTTQWRRKQIDRENMDKQKMKRLWLELSLTLQKKAAP